MAVPLRWPGGLAGQRPGHGFYLRAVSSWAGGKATELPLGITAPAGARGTHVLVRPSFYRPSMRRYRDEGDPRSLLAGFGEARLMHHLDGRLELVGGSETDRKAALEWLGRFLPDVRLGQLQPMLFPPFPLQEPPPFTQRETAMILPVPAGS